MFKIFCTLFYIGFFPFFPGTFASFISIIVGVLFVYAFGFIIFLFFTIFLFFVGWWSCNQFIKKNENKDPAEIVIDELLGQWISIVPILYLIDSNFIKFNSFPYQELVFAFISFRFFDIYKIGPILWADNLKTGLGIMLDDCIAGFFTLILITSYIVLI